MAAHTLRSHRHEHGRLACVMGQHHPCRPGPAALSQHLKMQGGRRAARLGRWGSHRRRSRHSSRSLVSMASLHVVHVHEHNSIILSCRPAALPAEHHVLRNAKLGSHIAKFISTSLNVVFALPVHLCANGVPRIACTDCSEAGSAHSPTANRDQSPATVLP